MPVVTPGLVVATEPDSVGIFERHHCCFFSVPSSSFPEGFSRSVKNLVENLVEMTLNNYLNPPLAGSSCNGASFTQALRFVWILSAYINF